jgi:hypothetical protein
VLKINLCTVGIIYSLNVQLHSLSLEFSFGDGFNNELDFFTKQKNIQILFPLFLCFISYDFQRTFYIEILLLNLSTYFSFESLLF